MGMAPDEFAMDVFSDGDEVREDVMSQVPRGGWETGFGWLVDGFE
jgi:hypothetical protein